MPGELLRGCLGLLPSEQLLGVVQTRPKAAAEQGTWPTSTGLSFHCHLLLLLPIGTMLPPAIREVERDEETFLRNRATDATL